MSASTPSLIGGKPPAEARLVVLFRLTDRLFGLPAEDIGEVLPRPALIRPPRRPPVVEGLFECRGALVTLLRADRLLGLPVGTDGLYDPILLLAGAGRRIGLLVRQVPGLIRLSAASLHPIASMAALGGCADASFAWDDEDGVLLAADRLLTAGEQQALQAFQQMAEDSLSAWQMDGL